MLHGCGGGGGSPTPAPTPPLPPPTPAPTPGAPTPAPPGGGWNPVGEGCCASMTDINATYKAFDAKPNSTCKEECAKRNSSMAVRFPAEAWCTCLTKDFNTTSCEPLCKEQHCCGSTGKGVWTYKWVNG